MTTPLITRLEEAAEGSQELSVRVIKAALAPENTWIDQSRFNGAWCIYERPEKPRLWEVGGALRNASVTESIDDALALAKRVLPGLYMWAVEFDDEPTGTPASARVYAKTDGRGYAATPAIAMCIAILKATRASHD